MKPLYTTVTTPAASRSLVVLAEGVAFVHGADDLLRSKSGYSNSFNSGDYFNRIYWDGSANNTWSVGLPPGWAGRGGDRSLTHAWVP